MSLGEGFGVGVVCLWTMREKGEGGGEGGGWGGDRQRIWQVNAHTLPFSFSPMFGVQELMQAKKSTKINFLGPETARWGGGL